MKAYQHQCVETVFGERGFSNHCQKDGVIERNGKWYCKIHDPEYKKAKREAWNAKYDADFVKRQQIYRRQDAMRKACEPFTTEELEAGIIQKLIEKTL